MEVRLALKAAGYVVLSVVGIPGNLAALLLFCHLFLTQRHMPHNEIILSQLVSANLTVTLCHGIPQALLALGINLRLNDYACRAIILATRTGRGMSITITSLLSAYQCVVIAPSSHGWTWLKNWLPGHLRHAIIFLLVLNLIFYTSSAVYIEAFPANGTIPKYSHNLKFCIAVFPGPTFYIVKGMVSIVLDFIFVGLMVAAGVYMIVILHRHRKQVQGFQGAGRKTEEASRAVLLLVSLYVALFSLDNILWFASLSVSRVHPAVAEARTFFVTCYSTISPVLIITTNKKLALYFNCGYKRKAAQNIQNITETRVS